MNKQRNELYGCLTRDKSDNSNIFQYNQNMWKNVAKITEEARK